MLASRPGDVTDPPPVELRGRVRRPRRAPGAHGAGRGGAGAVRGGGPGAGVPIVQAAALLPRAVVVGHDPAAGRLRVLARTRPSDAAGPRPRRRRDRLAAVLAVLAARRQAAVPRAGLLRPPGGRQRGGRRLPTADPDQAEGCRCVRNHPPGLPRGLPRGRLGLPACLRPGSGVGRERALAGRLPPSAERPAGGHRGASGGLHRSRGADGRRAAGRRPDRDPASAVPPAVVPGPHRRPVQTAARRLPGGCQGGAVNASASVLQVGDWVHVDGEDHQVVALSGTSVRLLSASGAASVVLASFLLGALDFALVKATTTPRRVEPFGLLEGLPGEAVAQARAWERHLVEVVTGLPPGAPQDAKPRPQYDVAVPLNERDRAKAEELASCGQLLGLG